MYIQFTIQNVSIKLAKEMKLDLHFKDLQYKMFLLNIFFRFLLLLHLVHLQYKMFLLNIFHSFKDEWSYLHLQYKMFLLNTR